MNKTRKLVDFDSLSADLRLWFLALFHRDIREAHQAASDAIGFARLGHNDQDPDSMYCRCHDAAVVRYARCFLGCNLPDGSAKIRLPERYKFPGAVLGTIHERIIAFRHGLVAHADMRERSVVLKKVHDDPTKPDQWIINASGGNLPPQALQLFISLCEIHRKTVVSELGPMIENRLSTMTVGETVSLISEKGGGVYWAK